MLGGHHAASGAATWIALTSSSVGLGALDHRLYLIPSEPAGILTGALVCAGAALLPDVDHRRSTLSRALPPITSLTARAAESAFGGHRQGTHSLFGIIMAAVLAWLMAAVPFGEALATLVLAALALKALKVLPGPGFAWIAAIISAAAVAWGQPQNPYWFPLAVSLGVVLHILGDLLTKGGVALFWPIKTKISFPLVGTTGSVREWLLMTPVSLYVIWGLIETLLRLLGVTVSL